MNHVNMTTPSHFTISVIIAATPAQVWEIMKDIESWNLWTTSVRRIKRLDSGPLAVGSKALIFQPKLPPAVWKITELDEGRGFTWVSSAPGLRVTARHGIEQIPESSRVTLSISYEGILATLMVRMTRTLNDRYLGLEAAGLKKRCEEV